MEGMLAVEQPFDLMVGNGSQDICLRIYGNGSLRHEFGSKNALTLSYYILTILSTFLSIGGASTIITLFYKQAHLRTPSRWLFMYLTVSDLFVAIGNLTGILWILINSRGNLNTEQYINYYENITASNDIGTKNLCIAQAAITSTSSLFSFFWTSFIALNIYLSVARQNSALTKRLRIIPHLLSWGIPLLLLIVTLGYQRYGLNICTDILWWCWITPKKDDTAPWHLIKWQLLTGKFWEIVAYVISVTFYGLTVCDLKSYVRRLEDNKSGRGKYSRQQSTNSVINNANKKLIFVPLVFIIARVWGTIRFLLDLSTTPAAKEAAAWLAPLQGLGDSAQGFLNCIVFVLTTPSIREDLPCRRLKIMFKSSQSAIPGDQEENEATSSASGPQTTHQAPVDYGSMGKTEILDSPKLKSSNEGAVYYNNASGSTP